MSRNVILAVGAHADDYEWGCGGSLVMHKDLGDKVYGLVMAGCSEDLSKTVEYNKNERIRIKECFGAAKILGLDAVLFAKHQDGRVTGSPLDAADLRRAIGMLGVTRLYGPFGRDDHSDHAATSNLVSISVDNVKEVLIYPGPRNKYFFRPNFYNQISREQLDAKIASYKVYGSQLKKGSLFVDMIEGNALCHGSLMAHGKPGMDGKQVYAEGFLVYKF